MNTFYSKTFFLLLLFILLFCSYRLLTWGITPCDELLYRGLLAKDIIDGLKAPLSEYTITPYSNDTHFLGFVSAPFFLLFGDSFLTLYIVTMLLPLCTLIGLYFFASKYFSPLVACISCYIYILAPFMYVHDNVYTSGLHADTAFFTLFILYCFYTVFFSPTKRNVYYGIDKTIHTRRIITGLFMVVC